MLNLNHSFEPSRDLLAYRKLYGLDLLAGDYWQGYIQMPLFRLHVQVFTPEREIPLGTVKTQNRNCMNELRLMINE